MKAMWTIRLLGELRVQCGGNEKTISRFRTRRSASLLAYLAFHANRMHSREQLAEMLWPDSTPVAGRNRLKQELSVLRRQLEPLCCLSGTSVLQGQGRFYIGINPDIVCTDVARFEEAVQAICPGATGSPAGLAEQSGEIKALKRAVELYGGPLLTDFYDEWITQERERLADLYAGLLLRLIDLLEESEHIREALDYAHRAVSADPLEENRHRAVMRLMIRAGHPEAALRQYQTLCALLRDQMNESPSEETKALAESLPGGSFSITTVGNRSSEFDPKEKGRQGIARRNRSLPVPLSPFTAIPALLSPFWHRRPLPPSLTAFFGREADITRLSALLLPNTDTSASNSTLVRLVTLTGPGGSGKTRLALEASRRLTDHFSTLAFVPLADITRPDQIGEAIASALGIAKGVDSNSGDEARPPVPERLAHALQELTQPVLLVLDNFEHLLGKNGSIDTIQELLTLSPALRCLITSRMVLGLEGEREIVVLPLAVPPAQVTAERLLDWPSAELFVDRAQIARADFHITPANAAAIAALCAHLEGIPLALELAAAWVQTLSPAQMLKRLDRRFELLVSRRRDLPLRHQTLRAAIEWSYHLLPADLGWFFVRLCVFRGGWTLRAAESVLESADALIFLTQLRERSLVTTEENTPDGEIRFRLLETLREWAQEQLGEKERAELGQRHADYFLHFSEAAKTHINQPDIADSLEQLEREHDNLRAALDWNRAAHDRVESGLRLVNALDWFWIIRGHLQEGRRQVEATLAETGNVESVVKAQAMHGAGLIALAQGDQAAAEDYFSRSLARYRQTGSTNDIAYVLNNLALIARQARDYTRATSLLSECAALWREIGDQNGIAYALMGLGLVAREQQDRDKAQMLFQESLSLQRDIDNQRGVAYALGHLAELATLNVDASGAAAHFHECLMLWREIGDRRGMATALEGIAGLVVTSGQMEQAAHLLGAANAIRDVAGAPINTDYQLERERTVATVRTTLTHQDFAEAWAEGSALTLTAAVDLGLNAVELQIAFEPSR